MPNPTSAHILLKVSGLVDRRKPLEAQKELTSGIKFHPNNYELMVAYARIAEQLGDWSDAAQRWKRVRQKFPTMSLGYSAGILVYLVLDNDNGAEQLITEGSTKFNEDVWFVDSCARLARKKGNTESALKFYISLQKMYPDISRGFTGRLEVLIEAKHLDEAEASAVDYLSRFPSDVWLAHSYAKIAMERQDWKEAVDRWSTLLSDFPGHKASLMLMEHSIAQLNKKAI